MKYELGYLHVSCGSEVIPIASVILKIEGRPCQGCSHGNGPIDALFNALKNLSGTKAEFLKLSLESLEVNTESPGKAVVILKENGKIVNGEGEDFDVITACAKAYVDCLNILAQ